jgi:hypothetical protein
VIYLEEKKNRKSNIEHRMSKLDVVYFFSSFFPPVVPSAAEKLSQTLNIAPDRTAAHPPYLPPPPPAAVTATPTTTTIATTIGPLLSPLASCLCLLLSH